MNNKEMSDSKYTLDEIEFILKSGASFVIGSGKDERTLSFFDFEGNLTDLGEVCAEDEPNWIKMWVDIISQETFTVLSVIETAKRNTPF